jgi:hypothetical protein
MPPLIAAIYARKFTRPPRLRLALLVVLAAFASSGCSHYWTRPQATLEEFAGDHRDCIQAGATPVVNSPNLVVPNEQEFRRCLIARGWIRREASAADVPPSYYRGYEERELGPVRIDYLPEQPASVKRGSALNRCRELYADPRLRKLCAERDSLTR